ncbi:MAG: hypothetical protein QOG64_3326 [Acidimicrobiaceae bacterium]|nr:hypothetical protein [Acidimicrobiaceae bacterium]
MTATDVIRFGREEARTGPWRGDHQVAFLAPLPERPAPSAEFVRRCLDVLSSRGFSRVVTGALSPSEQAGFLAAGFVVEERLHLLAHDLHDVPDLPPEARALRRARHRDRPTVLAVDARAFPPFWRLDERGLEEAVTATPRARFRVAVVDGRIGGYAICGRASSRGFVQRLAVEPVAQRHGLGRALMVDGLRWLRRRGVDRAVVNTQLGNDAALALYERLGFRREATGLSVLSTGLPL